MSTETDCSICREAVVPRATGSTEMTCGHKFHPGCISDWLTRGHGPKSCPLCRTDATSHELSSMTPEQPVNLVLNNFIAAVSNTIPVAQVNERPAYTDIQELLGINNEDYENLLDNFRANATVDAIWNSLRNIAISPLNYNHNLNIIYNVTYNQEILYE
jgi:hypothetical protein